MEISILLSVVMLSGAVLDIISPKGALGSSLQVSDIILTKEAPEACAVSQPWFKHPAWRQGLSPLLCMGFKGKLFASHRDVTASASRADATPDGC
jgi:hypothetical protein